MPRLMTKLPSIRDSDSVNGDACDDRTTPAGFEPGFFDRKWIAVKEVIGHGNFCQVHYGHLRSENSGRIRRIAVKRAKESLESGGVWGTAAEEDENLRNEYKLLKALGNHKHVVKLMGCSISSDGQFWLLLELMSEGTLSLILRRYAAQKRRVVGLAGNSENVRNALVFSGAYDDGEETSFIKKIGIGSSNGDLTSSDLVTMALQVARGMSFVASSQVLHRDLAARNILVNHFGICKVADFGLSRYFNDPRGTGADSEYSINSSTPLPIRWMAPEVFTRGVYTTKSDVWSFGVLVWEILTLGCTPYPELNTREVVQRVKTGHHPEIPPGKASSLRPPKVLWKCWQIDSARRPDFATICQELENHLICQSLGGACSPSVSPLPKDQYTVIPAEMGYRCGERV